MFPPLSTGFSDCALLHSKPLGMCGLERPRTKPSPGAEVKWGIMASKTGTELFLVDNSDADWKVLRYLHDWCQLAKGIDIATGYFEIGSLLALKDEWQKVDHIRLLMGDEVSKRTRAAFENGLQKIRDRLDESIENEKQKNDFLTGVPAIVEAIRSGKIQCKVYRKEKFHAKAYITHAKVDVVGSSALVGSSNFTIPGLTENIELNVQITGQPVSVIQEWYERHWQEAEDVTPDILKVFERHVREYTPFEVYAKALQEFFRGHEMTITEWEQTQSKMYPVLDHYQKEGYHSLMKIAAQHGGAFLCDGVGLGKTFVGLMVIERLVRDRKKVARIVPKAARADVWECDLRRYLPHLSGRVFNDLWILKRRTGSHLHTSQMNHAKNNFCRDTTAASKGRSTPYSLQFGRRRHDHLPGDSGTAQSRTSESQSWTQAAPRTQAGMLAPHFKTHWVKSRFSANDMLVAG